MNPGAPKSPDENENRIGDNYTRGLNSHGQEDVYSRGQARLDAIALRDRENREAANGGSSDKDKTDSVQSQEAKGGGFRNKFTGGQNQKQSLRDRAKGFITNKKKGPATLIIVIILGAMGFGGLFFGGTLAPLFFIKNVTLDLNDQDFALKKATDKLFRHKIGPFSDSDKTTLGCTAAGAKLSKKCAFKTLSANHKKRLESFGFTIEGDDLFAGRTKPTRITFDGVEYSPEEFRQALRSNRKLFEAVYRADNMSFIGLRSKTFVDRVLKKYGKTLSTPDISGSYKERVEQLKQLYNGDGSSRTPKFSDAEDAEGNRLQKNGEDAFYLDGDNGIDSDGNKILFTEAETKTFTENLKGVGDISKTPTHFSPGKMKAYRALSVLGIADGVCDFRNMVGSATVAAKVANSAQLAGYALDMAAFTGKLQLGTATPEDAEFIQRVFNDTDARKTLVGWKESGDEFVEGEVTNPTFGKNAMDSELYKMSANGGVAATSVVDQNYSLGFGSDSFLAGVGKFLNMFDRITSANNAIDDSACNTIQKWWVRGLGYVGGVILGGITFGGFTVLNTAIQVGLFIATQAVGWLLNAALQNNLITDTLLEEASVERGSAIWTGMSVVLGQTAQARGMMPGDAEEIVAYQLKQDVARQEYIAFERQQANPLDISNPYSLTGTVAFSIYSSLPKNTSEMTLTSAVKGAASLVSDGFGSLISPYSANAASLNPARFEQCDDKSYADIGISADVQCNVRYVMPSESIDVDPIEVAQWMEDQGYVEPDTTTGFPKGYTPPDGAKEQSIAKQFVMGVVDTFYDTRDYGERTDPITGEGLGERNDYGVYLDYCVYRALPFGETYEEFGQVNEVSHEWRTGENCRKTDDAAINMFRAYTFYLSANDDLDEGPIEGNINCGPSATNPGSNVGKASAEAIDAAIEASQAANPGNPHPLDGMGAKIIELSNKYGVNSDFIAVTLHAETQFAADGSIGPRYNNFGYNKLNEFNECEPFTVGSTGQYNCYNTPEAGIEGVLKNLTENPVYKTVTTDPATGPTDATPGTIAAVRPHYCPNWDGNCNLTTFIASGELIGIPISGDDLVFGSTSGSTTSGSGGLSTAGSVTGNSTGSKVSQTEFKQLFSAYGLPDPQPQTDPELIQYGSPVMGYEELLEQLKGDPKASWAAQAMLDGEKKWKSAGGELKDYLNTTWVWFENGQSSWPDPYEMNCVNDTSVAASHYCSSTNFQAAGYQPNDVRPKFKEVYDKLYSEDELVSVMENVIKNSTNASKEPWNYNDPSNSGRSGYFTDLRGVSFDSLWPNKPFSDEKAQIQSLILGKDPNMAAALNSFAVSDDDVLAHLGTGDGCGPGWGHYICKPARQQMANMMMALYMFDGQGPASSSDCTGAGGFTTGKGLGAIVEGNTNPENNFLAEWGNGLYGYGTAYGLNGSGHTGIDIGGERGAAVYTPVSGTVRCAKTDDIECHAFNSYKQDPGSPDTCTNFTLPQFRDGTGLVEITLDNGDVLILGHTLTSTVQVGQKVEAGQQVATVGCMNGHHIHVEYRTPDPSLPSGWRILDPETKLGRGAGSTLDG